MKFCFSGRDGLKDLKVGDVVLAGIGTDQTCYLVIKDTLKDLHLVNLKEAESKYFESMKDLSQYLYDRYGTLALKIVDNPVMTSADKIKVKDENKLKMPRVFHDWAQQFDLTTTEWLDEALSRLFNIYMTANCDTSYDTDLNKWLRNGADEELYAKCVDALVNGYEVEI